MKMADFDYDLPDERIAYTPAGNRSDSKLLVWDQVIIAEAQYKHIAEYIPTGHSKNFV
jgi:S-adenosylmethionine:tRNA ribosyltransferase-isomerase